MTDADLSRLPTGELGWSELIDSVIGADDRVERYYLELKSQIDLNDKGHRAKVAKFILGAANRDLDLARRRFDGHALMVLGVGAGQVVGVPTFEAKDLAASVQKWIGVDGPVWDFERIRRGEHDIIVIVVDPPTGDLWTCRADGDGLVDGGIYVRQDGETRRATGDEVRLLVQRALRQAPSVDIEVAVDGEVNAIHVEESVLVDYIQREAALLRQQVDPVVWKRTYGVAGIFAMESTRDRRSREEFLDEVKAWERESLASPVRGLDQLAARFRAGIRVRMRNMNRTFLRDVRLDLILEDRDVQAVKWQPPDTTQSIKLITDKPNDWGTKSPWSGLSSLNRMSVGALRLGDGVVEITRECPSELSMHLESLRPEEEYTSDDDEVVLVMFSDSARAAIPARWRITAQGIDDIFEGRLEIPVTALDWREPLRKMLSGTDETGQPDR